MPVKHLKNLNYSSSRFDLDLGQSCLLQVQRVPEIIQWRGYTCHVAKPLVNAVGAGMRLEGIVSVAALS